MTPEPPHEAPRAAARVRLAALAATLLVAATAVPAAWRHARLTPDSVHYLGIANAWLDGSGFVDPVKWNYFLPLPVPQPALLVRPPVPSLLAAVPLALGGGLAAVAAAHAALAALAAGGMVLLGSRMTSVPAGVAAALLVFLSPGGLALAGTPLSDVPATVALLAILASARGAATSRSGAVLCAAATLAGWATRPNLAAAAVAVLGAAVWESGVRRALGSAALRTYVALLAAGFLALHALVRAETGFAPYAGYGFMYQIRDATDAARYGHPWVGTWPYVAGHLPEIAGRVREVAGQLVAVLFVEPTFLYCGWLIAPGIAYALVSKAQHGFERRLCALAALGFTAIVVLTWAAFDPLRYPLPIVVCGTLCGMALLDDLLRRGAARSPRAVQRAAALLPVAAVLVLVAGPASRRLASSAQVVRALASGRVPVSGWRRLAKPLRPLCRAIEPGAVVAARDPWQVHLACGNAALTLPSDLGGSPALRARFLARERPRYVIAARDHRSRWVHRAGFVARARSGRAVLFELPPQDGRRAARWRQPPPLLCAGEGEACLAALGRRERPRRTAPRGLAASRPARQARAPWRAGSTSRRRGVRAGSAWSSRSACPGRGARRRRASCT